MVYDANDIIDNSTIVGHTLKGNPPSYQWVYLETDWLVMLELVGVEYKYECGYCGEITMSEYTIIKAKCDVCNRTAERLTPDPADNECVCGVPLEITTDEGRLNYCADVLANVIGENLFND